MANTGKSARGKKVAAKKATKAPRKLRSSESALKLATRIGSHILMSVGQSTWQSVESWVFAYTGVDVELGTTFAELHWGQPNFFDMVWQFNLKFGTNVEKASFYNAVSSGTLGQAINYLCNYVSNPAPAAVP